MAQLNSSNVTNGNIVESNDILQLYDAFTAGGGTTGVYDVSISGSLTGSATSASFASTALSSSFAVSSSRSVTSSYALTSLSSSFAISSSRAISASFSTNSDTSNFSVTTDQIKSTVVMPSGSIATTQVLRVAAGSLILTGSVATTDATDELKSKILGTTLFVNATPFNDPAQISVRAYTPGTGQIQFQQVGGSTNVFIMWTAYYVPS